MTMFNSRFSKGINRRSANRLRHGMAALLAITIMGCTTPNAVSIATTQKLIQHERNQAELVTKSIKLSTGDTLVYVENLNTSTEPLLLIHGFGGNKDNFTRIAETFKGYHVIIPDLLGFGDSDKPMDADYRAKAQAKRLHELMQSKGMDSHLHIAGNSMGGAISVAYAAMYPEEVASLWLIDSAGFWSVGVPKSLENATLEDNPLLINDFEDFENLTHLVMVKPPYIPKSVQAVLAQERIDNKVLESKILAQVVEDSVEEDAKVIAEYHIPTLIVWGEKDQIIKPETAAYIADIIPQAKVVMMPEVGHIPMLEAVKPTAKHYKDFRQELEQKQQ